MYFVFKEQLEDFQVEEVLAYVPSGVGDAWHLFIEKRGINTMDILDHLIKCLPIKREDIGIAGLKDKDGITRQRLTLYKRKIKQCGGEAQVLSVLGEKCQVLKAVWSDQPLMV